MKIKTLMKIFFLNTILIPMVGCNLTPQNLTQDEERQKHPHEAKYGGQFILQLGDNYHGEIVIRNVETDVYLFDKNMAPVSPTGESGVLIVLLPDKTSKNYPLTPTETFLKADFGPGNLNQFSGTITVVINGQSYPYQLDWQRHIHGVTDEHYKPRRSR